MARRTSERTAAAVVSFGLFGSAERLLALEYYYVAFPHIQPYSLGPIRGGRVRGREHTIHCSHNKNICITIIQQRKKNKIEIPDTLHRPKEKNKNKKDRRTEDEARSAMIEKLVHFVELINTPVHTTYYMASRSAPRHSQHAAHHQQPISAWAVRRSCL